MGGFQNFAISFTIISILAGCLTSYTIAFEHGGPVAVTWGWLLVGLMSTLVALAMAEIASAYPDRRRPLLLGVEAREPGLGLGTGWFNLDRPDRGHGGDRLRARDLRDRCSSTYWFDYSAHMDDWFVRRSTCRRTSSTRSFLLAAVLINMFNISITAGLNMISAWWHMVGVGVVVGILIIVPDQHQSLSYVFTETVNNSGYGRRHDVVLQSGVLVRL